MSNLKHRFIRGVKPKSDDILQCLRFTQNLPANHSPKSKVHFSKVGFALAINSQRSTFGQSLKHRADYSISAYSFKKREGALKRHVNNMQVDMAFLVAVRIAAKSI